MEGSDSSFSLLCGETDSCFNPHEDHDYSITDSDADYIQKLIQTETTLPSPSHTYELNLVHCSTNSLKCVRIDIIDWIFNTTALFGFNLHTAYLSLIYFDRFLSRRFIHDGKMWAIRLLSVACLSLAAKMEECKVPALSEYPTDDYNFESKSIQRMELFVLNTLEWKMGAITPFSFLHYFIAVFSDDDSTTKELIPKAIELVLSITKEINLMDHRPSVIAAAAVLAAFDDHLSLKLMEYKLSLISSFGSSEKEQVFSFYNLLRELGTEKSSTPESMISHDFVTTHSSSIKNSSITKRKLSYHEHDQHCPLKKIRRPELNFISFRED